MVISSSTSKLTTIQNSPRPFWIGCSSDTSVDQRKARGLETGVTTATGFDTDLQSKLQPFTSKGHGKHSWDEGRASPTPTRFTSKGRGRHSWDEGRASPTPTRNAYRAPCS